MIIEKLRIDDVAYMAHPVSGDVPVNLARAKCWVRWLEEYHCPNTAIVAPWITECEIWDDSNAQQRADGMARDIHVLKRCDRVIVVGGLVTKGMQGEVDLARALSMPVENLTRLGRLPPKGELGPDTACNFCENGKMILTDLEVSREYLGLNERKMKYHCDSCRTEIVHRR